MMRFIIPIILIFLCLGIVSAVPPDDNGDGCLSIGEISGYVASWLQGQITIQQVASGVSWWLTGCVSFGTPEVIPGWWDSNTSDSKVWTKRVAITLTEPEGISRTDKPMVVKLSDLLGQDYDYLSINADSIRVVDPSAQPDEPGEIYGNDVASQVEDIDKDGKLSAMDLLVFLTTVPANANKTYYLYFSENPEIQKKDYLAISWNLFSNPGFESGSGAQPTDWTRSDQSIITRSADEAYSGSYSLQFHSDDRDHEYRAYQMVDISPSDKFYSLFMGGWAKADSVSNIRVDAMGFWLVIDYDSSPQVYGLQLTWDVGTHDWEYAEVNPFFYGPYIKANDTMNRIEPYLRFDKWNGTFWVDDLFMYGQFYRDSFGDLEQYGFTMSNPSSLHTYLANEAMLGEVKADISVGSVECSVTDDNDATRGTYYLYDDGSHGDSVPGDGVWTNNNAYTIPAGLAPAVWKTGCMITDAGGNSYASEAKYRVTNALTDIHPRLYFTSEDIPALQAKIGQQPTSEWWNYIESRAFDAEAPPDNLTDAWRYRLLLGIRNAAFYYAVTGDETIGNKAKDWLLKIANYPYPTWIGAFKNGYDTPPETTAISYYASGVLITAAEGYDMLYPLLNDTERKIVRDAIIKQELIPQYKSYMGGYYAGSQGLACNRGGLISSPIGVSALSILGDDMSNTKMEPYFTAINYSVMQYLDTMGPQGGYFEGIGYMSFGMDDTGVDDYVDAYSRVIGDDLWQYPGFRNAFDFFLYFLPPDRVGGCDAFGDGCGPSLPGSALLLRRVSNYENGMAKWYYDNIGSYDFYSLADVIKFIAYDGSIAPVAPDDVISEKSKVFSGIGWAALRTGWGLNDSLIAFRSGPLPPLSSHNRPEQNSFTFDAYGKRLINEAGSPVGGWTVTYTYGVNGHNTLMLNNDIYSQPQYNNIYPYSPAPAGMIYDSLLSGFYDGVTGEAAPAYQGNLSKFTRSLSFVKLGNYLVVADDVVSAVGPLEFDSLLHTPGQNSITVNGNTAVSDQGSVKLYMKILEPQGFQYSLNAGQPFEFHQGEDVNTSYIQVWPASQTSNAKFLYVLYPVQGSGSPPPITELYSGDVLGVKVERLGHTDIILTNLAGGPINLGGVVTDGDKVFISYTPTTITHFAMHSGKTISFNGKSIYSSSIETSVAQEVSIPLN